MELNKKTREFLKIFLPFALLITAFCGLVLITVQQNYRQSANDPQIQIAEDISEIAANGEDPRYFIPQGRVDMSKSLATYIQIFDKNQKLLGSSAVLDNKAPELPNGVLKNAQKKGESRITWQPKPGVRSAIVVKYYKKGSVSGYVVVGRSLREVELREDNLAKIVFSAYVITLLATIYLLYFLEKKK